MAGSDGEHGNDAARVAVADDLARLTATVTAAFANDPLWGWAFPGAAKLDVWWRFLIHGALRYPFVSVLGDFVAVSVWIPPGASELTEADEQRVEPLLRELLAERAERVLELLERFAEAHTKAPPHYYLSLLATHPAHRGHGLGMRLLAENLARIDEQSMPAYLESSNPANVPRYERLGFEQIGSFSTPDDSHTVATMWRESR